MSGVTPAGNAGKQFQTEVVSRDEKRGVERAVQASFSATELKQSIRSFDKHRAGSPRGQTAEDTLGGDARCTCDLCER